MRRPPRVRLSCAPLEDRTLLNNRFVMPLGFPPDNATTFATLKAALTAPGLFAGDAVQIEPGAAPGAIANADLPAVSNLTIRGDLAAGPHEAQPIILTDPVNITGAQAGLALRNLNLVLQGGGLTFSGNATLDRSVVTSNFAGTALKLNGTTAAVVRDSTIVATNSNPAAASVVVVNAAAGANNLISGNTIASSAAIDSNLLFYAGVNTTGVNTVADQVVHNTFLGNAGFSSFPLVSVYGVSGLTFRGNRLQDPDSNQFGLQISQGQGNAVLDNDVTLTGAMGTVGIRVAGNLSLATTSPTVAGNRIDTRGNGTGLLYTTLAGSVSGRVEGNDFRANKIGVQITRFAATDQASGIDLGGGALGSLGGNNFRGFTAAATTTSGAIVETAPFTTAQTISARFNLFSAPDPETVILDNAEPGAGGAADVLATGNLTGNAAYVEALFLHFLHRAVDTSDPNGGAPLVAALSGGMTPLTAAVIIGRSPEALGIRVDGLYRQFLGRDADPAGRAALVSYLQGGGTVEAATAALVGSAEYRVRFGSDGAFVQSLAATLLGRVGAPAEAAAWAGAVGSAGRSALALGFLGAAEYRGRVVGQLFTQALHRLTPPADADVAAWVNSGLDLVTIEVYFAASPEFQSQG
jgi:hypothetical protein